MKVAEYKFRKIQMEAAPYSPEILIISEIVAVWLTIIGHKLGRGLQFTLHQNSVKNIWYFHTSFKNV